MRYSVSLLLSLGLLLSACSWPIRPDPVVSSPDSTAGAPPEGTPSGADVVVRVVDGDTVVLASGETVRYLCVDTPETVNPNMTAEPYGPEATDRNRDLVEGKAVRLESDVSERDHYGRLLRYVWIGDTLVNAELIRGGYGHETCRSPDTKYRTMMRELEKEARVHQRGLWASWPTPLP